MNHLPRALSAILKRGVIYPMELDKMPGWWVITAWPDHEQGVILRVRIRTDDDGESCELLCECRVRGDRQFEVIGGVGTSVWELLDELDGYPLDCDAFPLIWREEFIDMARRWALCSCFVDCGSATEVRYGAEPDDSRDCLEFPEE